MNLFSLLLLYFTLFYLFIFFETGFHCVGLTGWPGTSHFIDQPGLELEIHLPPKCCD